MRSTKEQTIYILQLKKNREAKNCEKRHSLFKYISSVACISIIIGTFIILPKTFNKKNYPTDLHSGTTMSLISQYTSENIISDENSSNSSASMIAMVSIDGDWYSIVGMSWFFEKNELPPINVITGEKIGVVEFKQNEYKNINVDSFSIYSTILPKGAIIYQWRGYSQEFRVCAIDSNGELIGFERIRSEGAMAAKRPVSDLFDFRNKAVEILICDNYPNRIGSITNERILDSLMQNLFEQSCFTGDDRSSEIYTSDDKIYRLYIRLMDNSITEIVVNPDSDYGNWIETVTLPDGFVKTILHYIDR